MSTNKRYDVVIGGGGLAGLSLARQLTLYMPELSVAVVDPRQAASAAVFKVGESSVEVGARYYGDVLQLTPYPAAPPLSQVRLAAFHGRLVAAVPSAREWGTNRALPVPSYQLIAACSKTICAE
jgi:glycine/D-amino acid oxidase-like deaminating enzyme